ncbi:gfo/Idh/MocA family oxidoreductase [Photobacterium sanctipauli]|uniref:Gfo/Idh/MocA family oxidoreductase n=1 Tax=Photobacterium sanctipauli TaxID=1342794 RepID=A0A2T3NP64_9GAMM|nr:Gfo/Idh/MocA family oxidoreductase [Photobacterium sanctipauli]PSW17997.1 gfo/Idh/MocA family oxidoreductase [Photobacterium sanctipauli]
MSQPLKWGVLGTSFISGVMADAIQLEGNTELYAVAGRSEAPRTAMAEQYGIPVVYDSYDAVIADEQVDIVYIALPNHLHHEYVVKAADAGKAILCEKSLSVDMDKTDQALAAVERNQVFFAEGLMYLNHPLVAEILDVINSGAIGDVRTINGQYTAAISQFVNPDSKGAIYNLGCYPASLTHLIMQQCCDVAAVSSYELSAMGRKGADGNVCESTVNLRFANGVMAQLHTAEDYGLHAEFTVLGSKGSLQLATNPWLPEQENQLVITEYEQPSKVVTVNADGNGFLYQVRAIRHAVERGKKALARPAATPADSRQIMQLLTDWEDAAKQHLG